MNENQKAPESSVEVDTSANMILFREHKKADDSFLLEIKLNNPAKLNVLNKEIIFSLNKEMKKWRDREDLSAVFIHSEGEKAFCAGGDVSQIYSSILEAKKEGSQPAKAVQAFFQKEYEVNYMLSQMSVPVVLWGDGFVIGGGMGLFMSASHPVVTEFSRLSMPEVSIGFFPDVGASYFLNQIPKNFGLYLALTASSLNASSALFLKLTKWDFLQKDKALVFDFMKNSLFQSKEEFNSKFNDLHKKAKKLPELTCWLKEFQNDISQILETKDFKEFYRHFSNEKKEDKKWERNRQNFLKASPTSLAVVSEQLKRAKNQKDRRALFEMELILAMNYSRNSDFPEGVRALLIDKTKDPKWCPANIEEITEEDVEEYFIADPSWNISLNV